MKQPKYLLVGNQFKKLRSFYLKEYYHDDLEEYVINEKISISQCSVWGKAVLWNESIFNFNFKMC